MKFSELSLKEKIYQMFVLGYEETNTPQSHDLQGEATCEAKYKNIFNAIENNLGGIIFFAKNLNKREGFKDLVAKMQAKSKLGLFMSIDQEGGLVERTICLDEKLHYLTPMALASAKNISLVEQHTQIMSEDLKSIGINMNFAPVLDVNTNPKNPIIGIRSFSQNTDEVCLYSQCVIDTFAKNSIIPVGKHFPGHGEAFLDSHKDMPDINLSKAELEKTHILPFKSAIESGLDAIMVAHVHFDAFDKERIPASLSKNVLGYLRDELNFDGLIISDDMVMGGIANHYSAIDACSQAILAGINLFIFRDSDDQTLDLIEKLYEKALEDTDLQAKIDFSVLKILEIKEKYSILEKSQINFPDFLVSDAQEKLESLAQQVDSTQDKVILDKNKKYLILSPDKSSIFNYSFDKSTLSTFLSSKNVSEVVYSLNPTVKEAENIIKDMQDYDEIIFVSYNAIFNEGQKLLFEKIKIPTILICAGVPYDKYFLNFSRHAIYSYGYNSTAISAIAALIAT